MSLNVMHDMNDTRLLSVSNHSFHSITCNKKKQKQIINVPRVVAKNCGIEKIQKKKKFQVFIFVLKNETVLCAFIHSKVLLIPGEPGNDKKHLISIHIADEGKTCHR